LREQERPSQLVASFIRKRSQNGQFVSMNEIFEELKRRGLLAGEKESAEITENRILTEMIKENEDLREFPGKDAPRYYSALFMSETYVRILSGKEGDPLLLIAEIVRENSAAYPRPVPLSLFMEPPFDLTQEEVEACLKQMAEDERYKDIGQTTTSIGTLFIYSTSYLETDHASMLAEWFDVGQFESH